MAINFGAPPRQASQVVKSPTQMQDEWAAAQQAYQAEQARIAWEASQIRSPEQQGIYKAEQHANSGAFDQFFKDQAAYNPIWNTQEQQDWYKQQYAQDVGPTLQYGGNGDAASTAYISNYDGLGSVKGYSPEAEAARLASESAAASSAFAKQKADFEAFSANQTRQQQAYNQQSGGGFAGGIIDASYSDPFSNQISGQSFGGLGGLGGIPSDPSLPNVSMPWAQPWGTPGFGQPGQGNSVGAYSPTGNQQQNGQQGSQWGGVFGAKNPWSPA